jgi:hypothetical protein
MKNINTNGRRPETNTILFVTAVLIFGIIALTANTFGQSRVKINEKMNQVVRFNPSAPVNTIKPAARDYDIAKRAGDAALQKRLALRAAQNRDMLLKAGNAALEKRRALQRAKRTADAAKVARRAAMAGTGAGVLLVAGSLIAEGIVGDSPDDIAFDAATSIAQGKRLDRVAGDIGKRIDPARIAQNANRNLARTANDASRTVNNIGRALGKIRLPF